MKLTNIVYACVYVYFIWFDFGKTRNKDEKLGNNINSNINKSPNSEITMVLIHYRAQLSSVTGESTPGELAAKAFSAVCTAGVVVWAVAQAGEGWQSHCWKGPGCSCGQQDEQEPAAPWQQRWPTAPELAGLSIGQIKKCYSALLGINQGIFFFFCLKK